MLINKSNTWFFIVAFSLLLLRCSCDGSSAEGDADGVAEETQEVVHDGTEDIPAEPEAEEALETPAEEIPGDEGVDSEDLSGDEAEAPSPSCFDPEPPGEYRGTLGCFHIYAFCSGAPSDYLLVKDGINGELTIDELSAIKDTIETDVMNLPFVQMFGITLTCCEGSTNAGCYSIGLQGNSGVIIEEMARRLSDIALLCGDPSCLGINVNIPPSSGPRCEPPDPGCLPVPMCDPDYCPGGASPNPGCCPECAVYDPAAARVEAIGGHAGAILPPDFEYLEVPLEESAGECTHDGHCVRNGCGQYCSSYDDLTFISTCECYPSLSVAFCGCVEGRCRWFYQ